MFSSPNIYRKSYKTLDEAIEELEKLKLQYPEVWQMYTEFKKNRKVKNPPIDNTKIIETTTTITQTKNPTIDTVKTTIETKIAYEEPCITEKLALLSV